MARTAAITAPSQRQAKHWLLYLATLRTVLSMAAIPLAPVLFRRHFVVLALMRPSQAVILAGAFLARQGDVFLPTVLLAAIPMQVLAVWLYFALGRSWDDDIDSDDELPFLAARLLNRNQIKRLRDVLERKGARLVFLARFAIFPTGLVSVSVGASEMAPRRYLAADGAGLALSTAASVGAGYVLGIAYDGAKPWLAAVGVVGLAALSGTLTWVLQRD
jgi:membrane protein DedA with SNARE-associated domain